MLTTTPPYSLGHIYGVFSFLPYYLPPAAEGDYKTPSVRACVCACFHSSRFYINLNISFIYKDIFTKFAGNVYGYKNLSVQNFGLILKNKMAAIANCSYMARKASLIVILAKFKKQNGRHITCLMSNGVILLKRPYISPKKLLLEVRNVKTTCRKS